MTTKEAIRAAAERIAPFIRTTPVIRWTPASLADSGDLYLKLESLQVTGSFKPRGAVNRLLTADIPSTGVITASGGNHGIAVAYAARKLGTRAEIYIPSIATALKRKMLSDLGATIVVAGHTYVEALAASETRAAETGALNVHAFNDVETVAGQGTIAIELEAQLPDVDTVLVAVGGGGFIGGISAWLSGRVKVVAVEPADCPTLHRALQLGMPVDVETGGIAADSLGCKRIGEVPFSVLRSAVRDAVLVSDDQIRQAQSVLWEQLRIVSEPGGATALAALTSGTYVPSAGEKIAVIICGGNADPATFA
jgi:threonine dehydratase